MDQFLKQYDSDKQNFQKNIEYLGKKVHKIPVGKLKKDWTQNLLQNTKVTGLEKKIPSISGLVNTSTLYEKQQKLKTKYLLLLIL